MKLSQTFRIIVLLACIFAAGFFTGQLTTPRPPIQIANGKGGVTTAQEILARLTAELDLDAPQKKKFLPLLEQTAEQMAQTPPGSRQRRDLFVNTVPKMRELLRPDQYERFDRYVQQTLRRIDRMMRRRDSQSQP